MMPTYSQLMPPANRPRYGQFTAPQVPPPAYRLPSLAGMAGNLTYEPPSYRQNNFGINDPTLVQGGQTSPVGSGPPDGAVVPPFQFKGGGIPNYLYAKGWRSRRGPDGQMYWYPPHAQQPEAPQYTFG